MFMQSDVCAIRHPAQMKPFSQKSTLAFLVIVCFDLLLLLEIVCIFVTAALFWNGDETFVTRLKYGDGFPTDDTETAELRTTLQRLNETYHKYPVFYFCCFTAAYLTRQMLPFSGGFAMNLISGSLYGSLYGYLLCVVLTTLAATLSFLFTRIILKVPRTTTPLSISAVGNLQMDDINTGFRVTAQLGRRTESLSYLHKQTFLLAALRLFDLLPVWLVSPIFAVVQLPLRPSILSAALAAIVRCLPALLQCHSLHLMPLYVLQHVHTASKLIIFAIVFSALTASEDDES